MAWLHAVPDKQKQSRLQALKDRESHWLNMPDISGGQYIMDMLSDLGLARTNMEPLTFQEIQAWTALTDTELTPFEAATLRELSEAYVIQLGKSRQPDATAPYDSRPIEVQRQHVSSGFRKLFERAKTDG